MTASSLLPCPWCGSATVKVLSMNGEHDGYQAMCCADRCYAHGPLREGRREAADAWNALKIPRMRGRA